METRRNIYTTIGWILIAVNLLVNLVEIREMASQWENKNLRIGYLIGSNILVIFGIVLLRMAYRLQKKIERKKASGLEESLNNLGND
jgi:hypothetical protein